MIEQKLTTYFKRYTAITPRQEFAARSRDLVTSLPQQPLARGFLFRVRETLTTGGALAMASFLLLVVLGGISYVSRQGAVATSSFNNDTLVREATELSFSVELQEAEYFDESASQVVRALDRIVEEGEAMQ